MKSITRRNYRKDKYFPKVATSIHEVLKRADYVAPIDVFVEMGLLTRARIEDWRFGRVPYLERVIYCNLSKTLRIVKILERHAETMKLQPTRTSYRRWGKRGRKRPLRFSKSGNPYVERLYSTHYVAAGRRKRRLLSSTGPGDQQSANVKKFGPSPSPVE